MMRLHFVMGFATQCPLLVDRSLFIAALVEGASDFSRNGGPASAF